MIVPIEQDKKLTVEMWTEVPIEDAAATLRRMQGEWALKNPKNAHEVYPDVYKADGTKVLCKHTVS